MQTSHACWNCHLPSITDSPSPSSSSAMETGNAPAIESKYSKRVLVKNILTAPGEGLALENQIITVGGWVKTGREQGKGQFAFLELNDGSCHGNLQVIVDKSVTELGPLLSTGTSVMLTGKLTRTPEGTKQKVELRAHTILHIGPCDPKDYPVAKTKLSLEYLRNHMHLRSRTNTIAAIARIRNQLAFATHTFFQEHQFLYVHTPIITTSDAEGAGEMFQVTTLLHEAERRDKEFALHPPPPPEALEAARAAVDLEGSKVKALKEAKAEKADVKAAVEVLNRSKGELGRAEERAKLRPGLPRSGDGKVDYTADFFERQAFLTVSGQLQVETYACSLSSCYTFGPTFRAENSHTTRHLAEFWMIEPEIAFADLEDDMNCAEDFVRYLCQWLLDKCPEDMAFMAERYDKECLTRLRHVASTPFKRLSYTEAIEVLKGVKDKKFENAVEWGIDLASEHERYLAEVLYQRPVIVYNYPKAIKAFYMRENEDGKTVAAMDVLVPGVGELVGGSQREERYDVLVRRLEEVNLPLETYKWYLDLRKFGTVKHCGFGLGFERMILFATGIENIRDVIPFPRFPGKADL